MFSLDELTPTTFEEFCYDLLTALGFVNVNWRKGTGLNSSHQILDVTSNANTKEMMLTEKCV